MNQVQSCRNWNLRSRFQYWRLFWSTPGRFFRRSIKAVATCPGSEKCAAYVRGKWGVCLRERGHFLRGNQASLSGPLPVEGPAVIGRQGAQERQHGQFRIMYIMSNIVRASL
ncbi:hypothetical protein XACLE20_710013 [Xanthomonas citri pv. citri]|nr:hypothetical protein XACLE20_710013 [Xanthomonas citri pv. citri]CEH42090.1 hypothetical protein XACLE3_3930006 [Xanthomonas citri pv. citri]